MSSILAIDPEILVVAGMPIAVVIIGGIVALWRRNGDGQRHVEERHVEEVPEKAIERKRRFDSIDEKLDEILALLGKP